MWCRRVTTLVQVGASRRLQAQLGRHAVRGRDMECLYVLQLMVINGYQWLSMAINGYQWLLMGHMQSLCHPMKMGSGKPLINGY